MAELKTMSVCERSYTADSQSEICAVTCRRVRETPSRFFMPRERTSTLVLCRFLKIRNHESRFILPLSERRNCELKNDSFSIHFTILLTNDSGQGIGIAFLLESESTQP